MPMSRLNTGPYRPAPDDWQGVFIGGDEAIHYGLQIDRLLRNPNDGIARGVVSDLAQLLYSAKETRRPQSD